MEDGCKGGTAKFIIGNIGRIVIKSIRKSKRDYLAGKPFAEFLIALNLSVDNQGTVCLGVAGKLMEGCPHIVEILEKVQMLCLYIENDAVFWEERVITICVFTCFRNE